MNHIAFGRLARGSVIALALTLSACASYPVPGERYIAGGAGLRESVQYGTAEDIETVAEDAPASGLGAGVGAVLGGLVGSDIGRGKGAVAGTLLGALAGGLGGNAIEHQARHGEGVQIVVRLDSGRSVAVVQPAADGIRRGDRVRIIGDGRAARVERA